jgi:parallel beta-helix repeat protein
MSQHRSPIRSIVRVGIICALLLVSLVPIRRAAAVILAPAKLYVSPSKGVDSWAAGAGTTEQSPYKNIQFAIDHAGPGTTIFLSPEVHTITQGIWWAYNRPQGNTTWMFMQPYPNQQQAPILECGQIPVPPPTTPPTNPAPCIGIEAQYVEIKGLKIRNAPHSGITVQGGSHVRLLNNEIELSKAQGIYVIGQSATDILIDGNQVHDNAQAKVLPLPAAEQNALGDGWASGIGIQDQASYVTVSNNKVYQNNGEGIGISSRAGTVVRGNILHDNFSVNLYINGARNATVEGNFIYTEAQSKFFRYNAPANGLAVANEDDLAIDTLSNLTISNNMVVGGRFTFYYGNFKNGGGMKDSAILNNTFFTDAFYPNDLGNSAAVKIDTSTHRNTRFVNNAVLQKSAGITRDVPSTGITFDYNGWYNLTGSTTGTGDGTHDVSGDVNIGPKLAAPGGLTAASYKLLAGSTLLNVGAPVVALDGALTGAPKDFWGTPRPQGSAPDIGAHEALSGPYQNAVSYPSTNMSNCSLATGDFNKDGREDVITSPCSDYQSLNVFLARADGTFNPPTSLPAPMHPTAILTADFNGDGAKDVAVSEDSGGMVEILLSNGAGGFSISWYNVNVYATSMTSGDFNGDGKPDLALGDNYNDGIVVLLNDGAGHFNIDTQYWLNIVHWGLALRTADINRDNKLDLVFGIPYTNQVGIMRGVGDGTFQDPTYLATPVENVELGDINEDGHVDMFVSRTKVFWGNSSGTFSTSATVNNSAWVSKLTDMNADGHLDIVGPVANVVRISRGAGNGTFPTTVDVPPGGSAIGIADVNGDGRRDLITLNNSMINVIIANP